MLFELDFTANTSLSNAEEGVKMSNGHPFMCRVTYSPVNIISQGASIMNDPNARINPPDTTNGHDGGMKDRDIRLHNQKEETEVTTVSDHSIDLTCMQLDQVPWTDLQV